MSEGLWSVGTTTFDLLSDTSKNILLPTITITPITCYATTWQMFRTSDNQDMVVALSSVYSIVSPNLVIAHTVSNFANRLAYFGSTTFYFRGSTDTASPTISSDFAFTIDF